MKIAVVGSGVSGLGAAYLLARAHDVHVFERDRRAGGHANTVVHDGLALDTGFLVHNQRNYPLLGRLFRELGVATHESDMSFSVSCSGCGLEYSGRRPFAQPANAARPPFLSLLWEIGRWLRTARPEDETQSLAEYLDAHGYSRRFRSHFLVPLTSALWSTAPGRALEFPAAYAIRFFDNHGMLGFGRFRWRTVTGGSRSYVDAIGARLGDRLRLGSGVRSIRRTADGAELRVGDGVERFDRVVIATHADQALALLEDPTPEERRVLGGFSYTTNEAVLHTDARFLPRARAARASWNYRLEEDGRPDDHLPPEPAAGARGRARLLPHAERARPRGARPRAVHLRAPALHGRDAAGPGRPAAACRRWDALRRRLLRQRLPRGRPRERRRSRARPGSGVVKSALYTGTLMHVRRGPTRHVFRYPVSYWLFDLDELPELQRRIRLFSVNRTNVVSLRDRDHFDGAPLKQAVIDLAGDPTIERVLVLTQPRVLGYVFNPVSFYWCYRGDGSLACMVSELNNTFGERLPEVLHGPELRYEHRKRLHVSPFFGLEQNYEYAFSEPGDEVWARIHVRDDDGALPLTAVLHGRRRELTNRSLAALLLRYPLQPLQVTALIHFEALRLWRKRVPFHHKPPFVPGEGSVRT